MLTRWTHRKAPSYPALWVVPAMRNHLTGIKEKLKTQKERCCLPKVVQRWSERLSVESRSFLAMMVVETF
jgi:hypothetical protein